MNNDTEAARVAEIAKGLNRPDLAYACLAASDPDECAIFDAEWERRDYGPPRGGWWFERLPAHLLTKEPQNG